MVRGALMGTSMEMEITRGDKQTMSEVRNIDILHPILTGMDVLLVGGMVQEVDFLQGIRVNSSTRINTIFIGKLLNKQEFSIQIVYMQTKILKVSPPLSTESRPQEPLTSVQTTIIIKRQVKSEDPTL